MNELDASPPAGRSGKFRSTHKKKKKKRRGSGRMKCGKRGKGRGGRRR